MNKTTVSVVMPAFNAERTIGHAIQSVLDGSFQDFEIVVCNDASTDRTAEVVRSFSDSRIRLIENALNSGEGFSRDRAIDASRGRWVAVLDADDAFTPNRLSILVEVAVVHPGDIVFDEIVRCHDTNAGMKPWKTFRSNHAFPGPRQQLRKVKFSDWLVQKETAMKPLIPTTLIRDTGIFHSKKRCSADLEFFLNILGRTTAELWYVPCAMYMYRMTPGGMSGIADRYTLAEATLRDAIPLFADDELAVRALKEAADFYRRTEEYRIFFDALRNDRPVAAIRIACRRPSIVPEFFRRSLRQIPYHLSRCRHGGRHHKRA